MKRESLFAFSAFLISFLVYLRTLCPTVYVVGSGELITAAHWLGIAHPTGYPLYCLLARLFSIAVPIGSVAYRMNLLSAILGAAAVGLLYLLVQKWIGGRGLALCTSLLFAFSSTFWSQAVIAEVYTLNAVFLTGLLLVLAYWRSTCEPHWLLFLAFFYGLSLTHHLTVSLWAPGLFAVLVLTQKEWPWRGALGWASIVLFLIGLSPYLYLPIRSALHPVFVWNPIRDVHDLFFHITGREYGDRMFTASFSTVERHLRDYVKLLWTQWTPLGVPFMVVGFLTQLRRDWKLFTGCVWFFLSDVIFSINYTIGDIEVFFIPSFFIATLWIGYGLHGAGGWIVRHLIQGRWEGLQRSLRYAAGLVLILFPIAALASNFYRDDRRHNRIAYQYGMDTLRSLDSNAILFTRGDDVTFVLLYLQTIEGRRPDVSVYSRNSRAMSEIYGPDYRDLSVRRRAQRRREIERQWIIGGSRPVYYQIKTDIPSIPGCHVVPEGLAFRVRKEYEQARLSPFWQTCAVDSMEELLFYKDPWVRKLLSNYHLYKGEMYLSMRDTVKAIQEYECMAAVASDSKTTQYNTAALLMELGQIERAAKYFQRALALDPTMTICYYGLGKIAMRSNRLNEAIGYYQQALAQRQEGFAYDRVYNDLGLVYARKGELPLAVRAWRRALQINPNSLFAQRNLRSIQRSHE